MDRYSLRLLPAVCGLLVAACAPVRVDAPMKAPPVRSSTQPAHAAPAILPPRVTKSERSGILFEGVAFDSRDHRLKVIDQAGGPGSTHADAASAALSLGGLAGVNGGFFTPEGEPLGRVIASGIRAGAWNSASSLGGGLWHADAAGRSAISRREKLGRASADTMHEMLQAGPMLVENGRAVSGLDAGKTSARTMILWDGGTRWWIGRSSPASLAKVADALSTDEITGWEVRHALNLDGGRSSELWVSPEMSGGPLARRPPWNRPVRNFLVLVKAK
jgi:Phosphodiester glycosidase